MDPSAVGVVMLVVLVLLVLVVAARSVRVVPPGHAASLERLGRHRRVLDAGLHFVVPGVDRLVMVDMRGQERTCGPHRVVTADDHVVELAWTVRFRVVDPRAAVYEIADYAAAVEQLAVVVLRNLMGEVEAADIDRVRAGLGERLGDLVSEGAGNWGIEIDHVELSAGGISAGIAAQIGELADRLTAVLATDPAVASDDARHAIAARLAAAATAIDEARRAVAGR